jgi:hypothetical protein
MLQVRGYSVVVQFELITAEAYMPKPKKRGAYKKRQIQTEGYRLAASQQE